MADRETEYNRALCERVHALRTAAGLSQAEVADRLGVHLQAWKKYEYRSPLPAYLMVPFAKLVRVGLRQLLGT